jgi:hypothetical protein
MGKPKTLPKLGCRKPEKTVVKLEYFYNGGQGTMRLWWTRPDGVKEPIPANAFRLPDDKGWGLRGQYFKSRDLKNKWRQRDDGTINFKWSIKPPFSGGNSDALVPLEIQVPEGTWSAKWINTHDGSITKKSKLQGGMIRKLMPPVFKTDIALKLLNVSHP